MLGVVEDVFPPATVEATSTKVPSERLVKDARGGDSLLSKTSLLSQHRGAMAGLVLQEYAKSAHTPSHLAVPILASFNRQSQERVHTFARPRIAVACLIGLAQISVTRLRRRAATYAAGRAVLAALTFEFLS